MSFWGAGANKRNRNRKMRNRASVYADVNQHRPREYWNYEALTIQWGYVSLLNLKYICGAGKWTKKLLLRFCVYLLLVLTISSY